MTFTKAEVAIILNEWVRKFAETPEEFDEILDENGQPFADYGSRGAEYFQVLHTELGL